MKERFKFNKKIDSENKKRWNPVGIFFVCIGGLLFIFGIMLYQNDISGSGVVPLYKDRLTTGSMNGSGLMIISGIIIGFGLIMAIPLKRK